MENVLAGSTSIDTWTDVEVFSAEEIDELRQLAREVSGDGSKMNFVTYHY